MRNREAARYARLSLIVAGLVVLVVVGVYVHRAIREARLRWAAPPAVPASVEQQSAQFSFSKVEKDRTIFTIRASQATRFKDQNRALLEEVWITIYGADGNRNDNIHTHECSYEPLSGDVRCQGAVQIDIQGAAAANGIPAVKSLEMNTSNLLFNRETGNASTSSPVVFTFPQGHGRGVGVAYDTRDSIVRVEHGVEFVLTPSERVGGQPVKIVGSSLEIRRNDRIVTLFGPASVSQDGRELTANKISFDLDDNFRVRRAVAEGNPEIRGAQGASKFDVSAGEFDGFLSPEGWMERIVADAGVSGTQESPAGAGHFSAAHLEITMTPKGDLAQEMTASGDVTANSEQAGNSRSLKAETLRFTFAPFPRRGQSPGERIESAETLGPAAIESKAADATTILRAKNFVAQFGADGRLEKLLGHSAAEVWQQTGKSAPQVSTSDELAATFGPKGEWDTVEETGNVRFHQAARSATAQHAGMVSSTAMITLDGLPVLSDATSRTTASTVAINQKSGEIAATGGVVSTYLAAGQKDALSLGSGAAHISADALSGSTTSGHVIYSGHARLWQGASLLYADRIEIWRDEKKLQATGHVVAVFPQTSGPLSGASPKPVGPSSPLSSNNPSAPVLWEIRAPTLTYWSEQGMAHLDGGVTANSPQGSLQSRSLDVYLTPSGASPGPPPSADGGTSAQQQGVAGGRQLTRAVAQGGVVVRQDDRRGMASQAVYIAAEGKFVLSGGQPTLTDASGDTTTGHSLTFFASNDTILIESQEGSRTLTRHRVEK